MTDAISSILAQIRAHEASARPDGIARAGIGSAIGSPGSAAGVATPGFQQTLTSAINKVSHTQATSSGLQQAFEMGDPRADLARVMVAMQESQVAFRATVEVRNRLVQAYQDVMNMPI